MANFSQDDILRPLRLILAATDGPLSLNEIERRLLRAGCEISIREVIEVLKKGPFRPIGQKWEFDDSGNAR